MRHGIVCSAVSVSDSGMCGAECIFLVANGWFGFKEGIQYFRLAYQVKTKQ